MKSSGVSRARFRLVRVNPSMRTDAWGLSGTSNCCLYTLHRSLIGDPLTPFLGVVRMGGRWDVLLERCAGIEIRQRLGGCVCADARSGWASRRKQTRTFAASWGRWRRWPIGSPRKVHRRRRWRRPARTGNRSGMCLEIVLRVEAGQRPAREDPDGRKSDVLDAEWWLSCWNTAVRGSFVPPPAIRECGMTGSQAADPGSYQ